MHSSGKTKELIKIYNKSKDIYKTNNYIYISSIDSLTDWFTKNLKTEDTNKYLDTFSNEDEKISIEEDIKKQHIKIQILINKTSKGILFIDDLDQAKGKKKEVIKDLIKVSKVVIATAKNEKEIDKTISAILFRKGYNEVNLNTNMSYDATNILFVIMILTMLTMGQFELAGLILAGKYAMKGKDKK